MSVDSILAAGIQISFESSEVCGIIKPGRRVKLNRSQAVNVRGTGFDLPEYLFSVILSGGGSRFLEPLDLVEPPQLRQILHLKIVSDVT